MPGNGKETGRAIGRTTDRNTGRGAGNGFAAGRGVGRGVGVGFGAGFGVGVGTRNGAGNVTGPGVGRGVGRGAGRGVGVGFDGSGVGAPGRVLLDGCGFGGDLRGGNRRGAGRGAGFAPANVRASRSGSKNFDASIKPRNARSAAFLPALRRFPTSKETTPAASENAPIRVLTGFRSSPGIGAGGFGGVGVVGVVGNGVGVGFDCGGDSSHGAGFCPGTGIGGSTNGGGVNFGGAGSNRGGNGSGSIGTAGSPIDGG